MIKGSTGYSEVALLIKKETEKKAVKCEYNTKNETEPDSKEFLPEGGGLRV